MITFSKSDFWRAFVAGALIALLALPVLKNLGVLGLLAGYGNFVFYLIAAVWLVFLPLAVGSGLYIVYCLLVPRRPTFYRIGKYGIVGLLNTFLTLGILNFLIIASGIDSGIIFDFFVAISFLGGVTNAFFWNKFWTFESKRTEEIKKEYLFFFAVTGATTLINIFLMHIFVNVIGAPFSLDLKVWANISSLFLIPVSFFGNFFGWKILVFKKNSQPSSL